MIGIDLTYMNPDDIKQGVLHYGSEKYLGGILSGFVELGLQKNFVLITKGNLMSQTKKMFPDYKVIALTSRCYEYFNNITRNRLLGRLDRKIDLRKRLLNKIKVDCLWYPYGIPYYARVTRTPYVITVLDLMQLHNPELNSHFLTSYEEQKTEYGRMIENASKTVTISDYVLKDIENVYEKKYINAVSLPIPVVVNTEANVEPIPELVGVKYILDVNNYSEHKNLITLIKAFETIYQKCNYDLCCCGSNNYGREIAQQYVDEHGLTSRVHLYSGIEQEKLNWLFKNSSIFVTPSLDEGFGLTPIEAAIYSIPVISTKCTSLYEVTKGLVNYYENPTDYEELSSKLLSLINNPPDKNSLNNISQTLKECYSNRACASNYWEIFSKYCI